MKGNKMMFSSAAALSCVLSCSSRENVAFSLANSYAAGFAKDGAIRPLHRWRRRGVANLGMTFSSPKESDSGGGGGVGDSSRRSALIRVSSSCFTAAATAIASKSIVIVANAAEFSESPMSTVVITRDAASSAPLESSSNILPTEGSQDIFPSNPTLSSSQLPANERPMIKTADIDENVDFADINGVIYFLSLATAITLFLSSVNDSTKDYADPVPAPSVPPSGPLPYGLGKGRNNYAQTTTPVPAPSSLPSAASPYGLDKGRNFYEGVDVKPEPKQSAPVQPKSTWKLELPVPYGIQNKGRNPFMEKIEEYCDAGEVNDKCTDSIKGYLDSIETTGKQPSKEAASAIVSYLDSLSKNVSNTGRGDSSMVGTGLPTYLDALSWRSQSTPSLTSAKHISGYLDCLGSDVEFSYKPVASESSMSEPKTKAAIASSAAKTEKGDEYDNRLANIETRVSKLESSVLKLPDEVFNKLQQWQSKRDQNVINEVRKIVGPLKNQNSRLRP